MHTFLKLFNETQIEYAEHCVFFDGKPNCTFDEMFYFRLEEWLGIAI